MSISSVLDTQQIISTTDVTDTTSNTTAAEEAEETRQQFLQMLLTQLQNQNPLDPMDTTEYAAQLSRYSQVEQLINMNESMATVETYLDDLTSTSTFSYVGQSVEIGSEVGVVQDDTATWSYAIDGAADNAYITITDGSGNVLYEDEGSTASGAQSYTLDASLVDDIEEGDALYFYVSAVDNEGNSYDTDVTSHLTVDGSWSDGDNVYLSAGSVSFLVSDVLKVDAVRSASAND